MGEITKFPGVDDGPAAYNEGNPVYSVDRVIESAREKDLDEVMILGWDNNDELYVSASNHKRADLIYLLELVKHKLLSGDFE